MISVDNGKFRAEYSTKTEEAIIYENGEEIQRYYCPVPSRNVLSALINMTMQMMKGKEK